MTIMPVTVYRTVKYGGGTYILCMPISERTFYNMLKASADPKNDLPDDTVQLKFNFDWE